MNPSNPFSSLCGVCIAALWLVLPSDAEAGIVLQANYEDSSGEGFYDSTLGQARRDAFEYALNIWGNALGPSHSGETIKIDAEFNSLGGSSTSATLGQAGTDTYYNLNTNNPLIYHSALANHIVGYDLDTDESEGFATFNSDIDGGSVLSGYTWYYGTDNNAASNQIDFVSVVLHEIGHALGFSGLLQSDGNYFDFDSSSSGGSDPELFNQYDYYVVRKNSDGTYTPLRNLSASDRITAATNDNIYWGGAEGIAANGGVVPKLYAPSQWAQGSSYSHLDEDTFSLELMSPEQTAGTPHEISALTLGMMYDMGWSAVQVPEPATFAIWSLLAFTVTYGRGRRRGLVAS
ncbi:MAG: hypothetical protein VXZ38_05735 [Planctomycetota bacterium]|nr:hypothetical protein [Planctomycetota bacterium]